MRYAVINPKSGSSGACGTLSAVKTEAVEPAMCPLMLESLLSCVLISDVSDEVDGTGFKGDISKLMVIKMSTSVEKWAGLCPLLDTPAHRHYPFLPLLFTYVAGSYLLPLSSDVELMAISAQLTSLLMATEFGVWGFFSNLDALYKYARPTTSITACTCHSSHSYSTPSLMD